VAALLVLAQTMLPEGCGRPKAAPKDHLRAPFINALLVNVKQAIGELWNLRGYSAKVKAQTKAKLGYALDQEEAIGYLLTGAVGKPLLSAVEARAIGKRVGNSLGEKGALGKELRERKKRGMSSEDLLLAPATLNLSPPPRRAATQPAAPAAEFLYDSAPEPSPAPPPLPPASAPQPFALPPPTPMHAYSGNIKTPPDYVPPPLPPPPASARGAIKRLFGSREAAEAIYACRDIEIAQDGLAQDAANVSHPLRAEFLEIGQRHLATARNEYTAALLALKEAFPAMVCCDAFERGACAHGKQCECGWQQAPWPWMVQRSNAKFCDCHMDTRRAWMKPAGIRYWE
jgi:hypothetical protein